MLWRLVIAAVLVASPVQAADIYLNLGIGASLFQKTTQDGTWYQERTGPYQFRLTDLMGKAGLGFKLSPEWAVETNVLAFGQAKSDYWAIDDEHYLPSGCVKGCDPRAYTAKDRMFGVEVAGVRSFQLGDFSPFLKGGAFLATHDLKFVGTSKNSEGQTNQYSGYVPGVLVGGGVCYSVVCGEATYYHGIGSTGYPIARNIVTPMLTMKIPLSF